MFIKDSVKKDVWTLNRKESCPTGPEKHLAWQGSRNKNNVSLVFSGSNLYLIEAVDRSVVRGFDRAAGAILNHKNVIFMPILVNDSVLEDEENKLPFVSILPLVHL